MARETVVGLVVALLLVPVSARKSSAGSLCAKRHGPVVFRQGSTCKRHEIFLDPAALGLIGLKGEKGDPGPPGPSPLTGSPGAFPTDLPSGVTLRGVFQVAGTDTPATAARAATAISFVSPLAERPEPHYVPEAGVPPPECPGTVHAPAALPGHLCVFEGDVSNASNIAIGDPETGQAPGTSRFGATISAVGSFDSNFALTGTWAVTAR